MAVKIRLMRIGAKKRPFYRVVSVDERRKRTGKYIELLGTYNPLTEPHEIILKKDRIDYWIKNGAQLSSGYLRITKQAPQKPPRKPKKERKETTADSKQETEEQPVNEQPTTDNEPVPQPDEPSQTPETPESEQAK